MFRELDENGDIKAGTFLSGAEAVGANVASQIQEWARENPLDLSSGIDWAFEISNLNSGRLCAQLRDIAFKCKNVTAVSESINLSEPDEDRFIHISFNVMTSFGEAKIKVQANG